jgi:long-subunit fatty acid transport protein
MNVIFALLVFFSSGAWAAFSNYNSILIGDQAAGMAGATTAMVGDSSACAFYNPASCALLKGKSFSAAVGIYKKYDTIYGDNVDLTKAGLRMNQGFFRPLPSSTGSIVRFKDFMPDWTFSLSIVTPEYDTFQGDLYNSNNSKTTLSFTDESLWVGPSISRRISSREAVGVTIYYTARSYSKALTDRTFVSSTQSKIYEEQKSLTQNAIVAILGYQLAISKVWRLGASIRLPSMHVAGSAVYFDNTLDSGTTLSTNNLPSLDSKSHIPAKYTLGIAYEEPGSIAMDFDISTYSHENYRDMESDVVGVSEELEHRSIINTSFGMEFYFKKWLKMRIGAFTNFSSHPDPDVTKVRGQGDHLDQLGWASNLAMESGPITYTFGGYYTGGRGQSAQRINQSMGLVSKTQQVFTMLVGTSYAF